MLVLKPPAAFPNSREFTLSPKVFLAGSIEMGTARDWQSEIEIALSSFDGFILNPRRLIFDNTLVQSINTPTFKEQVDWELDAQDEADIILMNFLPETKAPITLLELGLYAQTKKLIVCCPDGFWRKGNVEIICDRFSIPLLHTFKDFVSYAKASVQLVIGY